MFPNCKAKNPSERVKKTPKYRCADCKHEFDEAMYSSIDELISIFYEDKDSYEIVDKCFVSKDKWKNKIICQLLNIGCKEKAQKKGFKND